VEQGVQQGDGRVLHAARAGTADEHGADAAARDAAARRAVAAIRKEGVSLQVHKRGAEGAKAYEGEQSWTLPPLPTEVVCAIGAGEAFASGLLYGLCRGLPAGECLQYGNTAASLVVGRVSCSDSMPYREELEPAVQSAYSGQRR